MNDMVRGTGAVIMGRKAFDERLTFTFVTDGITPRSEARQLLEAGLVDELSIDVMHTLLGEGLRLFEGGDLARIQRETIDVRQVGPRTTLRFRVKK